MGWMGWDGPGAPRARVSTMCRAGNVNIQHPGTSSEIEGMRAIREPGEELRSGSTPTVPKRHSGNLGTYLPRYPPTHLPTYLPTYPPIHLSTYPSAAYKILRSGLVGPSRLRGCRKVSTRAVDDATLFPQISSCMKSM